MKCKNCGNALPDQGAVCKFCGVAMNEEQIKYQNKMKDRNQQRLELLSEKYGRENKIEYRETKENKALGLAVILIILLFLIILTILVNVIK